jgi:hypothetical protein
MTPEQEIRDMILHDLREIKKDVKSVIVDVTITKVEVKALKGKVAMVSSAVGSTVGAVVAFLVSWFQKH